MFIFQTGHVTLIHIPIKSFRHFLGPVLQLLLYWDDRLKSGGDCLDPDSHEKESSFINISVTPIECSIVCPRQLAVELFESALSNLDTPNKEQVIITEEDYVVVQVEGEGLNAGQRVVDLTTPLALAGMYVYLALHPTTTQMIKLRTVSNCLEQTHLLRDDVFLGLHSCASSISGASGAGTDRARLQV